LLGGNTSGVEIYTTHLIEQILKIDQGNRYVFFLNSAKKESALIESMKNLIHTNSSTKKHLILHTKYPNRIFNLSLIFLRYPKLDKLIYKQTGLKPNIFFAPDLRPAPISTKSLKITTIHDLTFKHFPKFFSIKSRIWFKILNVQKEITESNKIIAVSNFTKKDITRTYKINPKKIITIHEGIDPNFANNLNFKKIEKIRHKYKLPQKFFLFLSTIEPRKNINNLIESYEIFTKKWPEYSNIHLVIAGKTNNEIFSKITGKNTKNIHFPGFINEKDKATIYVMATTFIYPSIMEGFGLPLLEAMKCEVPIITSNNSSIPEVVEKSAILINPINTNQIAKAMHESLSPRTRIKLKILMEKQVKKFSWEKCAKKLLTTFYLSLQNREQK